jgi:hypothetical protein
LDPPSSRPSARASSDASALAGRRRHVADREGSPATPGQVLEGGQSTGAGRRAVAHPATPIEAPGGWPLRPAGGEPGASAVGPGLLEPLARQAGARPAPSPPPTPASAPSTHERLRELVLGGTAQQAARPADPNEIAAALNDVLVEQARRHGVDLS